MNPHGPDALLWTFFFGDIFISSSLLQPVWFFFLRFYVLFLERGKEGTREGVKHQCVVASSVPPTGNMAYNPGMCPDWESNWQRFSSQAYAQSTVLHQPGPAMVSFGKLYSLKKLPISSRC